MKKRIVAFTLLCISALAGCSMMPSSGEESAHATQTETAKGNEPEEQLISENTYLKEPVFDTPVLALSNGVQTEPYVHMMWAKQWSEDGWLMADMASFYDVLAQINDELPEIVYGEDFTVYYKDGVSFVSTSVYDGQSLQSIYKHEALSILEELPAGIYDLGIVVKELGRYIKSEKEYEETGYECVYRLVKPLEIGEAEKLTIQSGTTGEQVEITNMDDIAYITNSINAMKCSKGEKVNGEGWSYRLKWYGFDGEALEEVTLLGDSTLIFDGYYYKSRSDEGKMDLSFWNSNLRILTTFHSF